MFKVAPRFCLSGYRALPPSLQSSSKIKVKHRPVVLFYNRLNLVPSSTAENYRWYSKQTSVAETLIKKHANIGTIGHVDHGKTTLTGY
jgi:hypothetical protein